MGYFGRRVIAEAIDVLLMWLLIFAIDYVVFPDATDLTNPRWVYVDAVCYGFVWLYFLLCIGIYRNTVGQYLLKIVVVDKNSEKAIGLRRSAIRNLHFMLIHIANYVNDLTYYFFTDDEKLYNEFFYFFAYIGILFSLLNFLVLIVKRGERSLNDIFAGYRIEIRLNV